MSGIARRLMGASEKPLSLNYITNVVLNQSGVTKTFSSVSLGQARSDRLIVVVVGAIRGDSTGQRRIASATIAGISANIVSNTNPYQNTVAAIIYAEVPTGATGDVVITFEGNSGSNVMSADATIGVYAIYDAKSTTPIDSDYSSATTTPSITLDTAARGAAIFMCSGGFNSTSISWSSGVTQNFLVTEATSRVRSAASTQTSSTSITATATVTGANGFMSGASWR
jgi:hypothetical protein